MSAVRAFVVASFALLLAQSPVSAFAAPSSASRGATALRTRAVDAQAAAQAAARRWQKDAVLVYAESADSLEADASASAWSFLYRSDAAKQAKGFTVSGAGSLVEFAVDAPFAPPSIEPGFVDATVAIAAIAEGGPALRHAVLSRGLSGPANPAQSARTTWLFVYGETSGEAIAVDAIRGSVVARGPIESGEKVADGALPPYFAAHESALRTRASAASAQAGTGADRSRWLEAREGAALARLSAGDAAVDTLGRAAVERAAKDVDRSLADLAAWRSKNATLDSAVTRSAARVRDASRDLAAERPTELALYLSVADRARPSRVTVSLDGIEIAAAAYGDAEWRALDAGAWAEVLRAAVRPGAHTLRVDLVGADRRVAQASLALDLAAGKLGLVRLVFSGQAPRLEVLPTP